MRSSNQKTMPRKKRQQIKLGGGGYRGRPEGWVGDLGEEKNAELVKLGRATYVTGKVTKEIKPARKKRGYRTK